MMTATGLLAVPWAAAMLFFAIFTTGGVIVAAISRLLPDWDPQEGLPGWDIILPAAIVPVGLWFGAFEALGKVFA